MNLRFRLTLGFVLAFASTHTYAEQCEENFSTEGSFLTGKTFKTVAELANVSTEMALRNVVTFTSRNGFTVLTTDKSQGVVSAVQADSYAKGKKIPLDIAVEKTGGGVKISMIYATPAGMLSPEDAVKSHFCKTVVAAAGAASNANSPDASMVRKVATPPSPGQQQFIKNGMYCMNEICIGDDISTLTHVKWNKVKANPINANNSAMKSIVAELASQPMKVILEAAPYLFTRQFDQMGIEKLAQVRGFCESHANFEGTFNSDSGHPTFVTARVEPGADGSTQAIRVSSITRRYPNEYTNEQLAALTQQLTERYGKVKHGENDPSWGIGPDRVLFLRGPVDWDGGAKRRNLLKQFPGCGKALKID